MIPRAFHPHQQAPDAPPATTPRGPIRAALLALLALAVASCASHRPQAAPAPAPDRFAQRAADWRNGAVVYQVIVDRFAPPADLEAKRHLYPEPKKLRTWEETPARGHYVEGAGVWSHEIDFWGGDFRSLSTKLDYVQQLGVDVLYLNPIHLAYTNHKYDAQDYFAVSPEYGTRGDVVELARDVHARGMRLVLDGVFNHMGRSSPWFREAMANPSSPWREWYYIGPQYKLGYRAWVNVPNLPEVNLESPRVRARLWGDRDSVVQGYLRDGVDGWRLDVAFDIGYEYLAELTRGAHAAKPGSLVVGELWNYPQRWVPGSVDGTMNMPLRELLLQFTRGALPGATAGRQIERMAADAGIEPLLKSWLILDNHDTQRLATSLPQPWQRRIAQVLQFTLPGSPCLYYGTELGMAGGDDPEQRAPMRWDLVREDNEAYAFTRRLIAMHNDCPSLRIGDYRALDSTSALAFMRTTDSPRDTAIVLANAGEEPLREVLMVRDPGIMSYTRLRDELSGAEFTVMAATLDITIPPRTVHVLRPVIEHTIEYSPYKRVP